MDKMDYKKVCKDIYVPKKTPTVIDIPEMLYIQVEGSGNPNTSEEYKKSIEILYGLSFGIKMGLKFGSIPQTFILEKWFPQDYMDALIKGNYVVPPLEGLWWTDEVAFDGRNVTDKEKFHWISMIRQPEIVTEEIFQWAKENLLKKKPFLDTSSAKLVRYTEGLCCQVMHIGAYDDEPATIARLDEYILKMGYQQDFGKGRYHHEIYLGDPRRTAPEKLKTVIRHPIRMNTENYGEEQPV